MQAVTVAPQGQSSGKAIAALVLGIVGMFAWFIPLFCLCALVLVVLSSMQNNPRVSNLDLALDSE